MVDPVRELKVRAEILHHRVTAGDRDALERLRVLPEWRKTPIEALRAEAAGIQRKHCLAAVAREAGFASFAHAVRVMEGDAEEADLGKLLYRQGGAAHLNTWYATYEEARAHREARGDYLLAYGRQFFIADRYFVAQLGLDPDDTDWAEIGFDWARPRSAEARRRLYGKLLARREDPKATETLPAPPGARSDPSGTHL